MKRTLSSIIVLIMMCTCFGFGTVSAGAAEKDIPNSGIVKKKTNEGDYKEGEALVVFKSDGTLTKSQAAKSIGNDSEMKISKLWDFEAPTEEIGDSRFLKRAKVKGIVSSVNVALIKSDTLTTKQLVNKLKKQENVKYAEPNYKVKALSTNDTYFSKQWNLENTGQNNGTAGKSTNVSQKWNETTGSNEKVVAIVDTGVDYLHEDLKANMWENTYQPTLRGEHGFDFINGDPDPMDDNGHGSHCAGIIGAAGNNGVGISGINQNVKIMALKMLDGEGSGYASEEVSCYHYINKAMSLGVNVVAVNNSWGGGESSKIFETLVDIVGEKGAVSVCAAGNETNNNDVSSEFPANLESPYKLSVAAANEKNELASFSNYGKTTVDIAAPGADILSTVAYDCYNPSIYGENAAAGINEKLTNFETNSDIWGLPLPGSVAASLSEPPEGQDRIDAATQEETGQAETESEEVVQDEAKPEETGEAPNDPLHNEISAESESAADNHVSEEGITENREKTESTEPTDSIETSKSTEANNSNEASGTNIESKEEKNMQGLEATLVTDGADSYDLGITGEEYFGAVGGKSLKMSFKNVKENSLVGLKIPYSLVDNYDAETMSQRLSSMMKVSAPDDSVEDLIVMADVSADKNIKSIDDILDENCTGAYVSGTSNYWDHLELECGAIESEPAKDRAVMLLIYAEAGGDYELYLDDLGLSRAVEDTSVFGKYDYYNGTSMAAPHVTGAIALAAAEYPKADSVELISTVLTHVNKEDALKDKVDSGGVLDYSQTVKLGPKLSSVTVNQTAKQIIIKGSGFDNSTTVKIDGKTAEITDRTNRELKIKDNAWINKIVTLEVAGNGKTVVREGIYLVKGKVNYTEMDTGLEFPSSEGILSTNGKEIYCANSGDDSIYRANTADGKDMEFEGIITVKAEKYFKKDSNTKADYDFSFGKDLPYADGKLYNITAYSEVGASGGVDDFDEWEPIYLEEGGGGDSSTSTGMAFSSQYKLMSFDLNTGKVANLGSLPSDIEKIEECTLTSYNGKIYLIGGYDYGKKALSKTVKVYNPATKKWSKGPSLPEGRAGGVALQSGNSLIYTLGYSDSQKGIDISKQECPVNLIMKNGKWTKSAKTIQPYILNDIINRGGNKYLVYKGSVGLCASGLVYAGIPTDGLGDTFTYNVNKDTYESTKYIFEENPGMSSFTGVMAGSTLYGYDEEDYTYKAVISSGLLKVTAPKYKCGKISGANVSWLPGKSVTLKAVANKGYYVKSFYVDGKKVSGKTKTVRLVKNQKAKASFGRYVSKITLKKNSIKLKAGKTYKLRVSVAPSNATNKAVTYKSGNPKYATVSSKGVIKTKRAGKGKTVTITVTAKDGSKKTAKCKVKILK